MKRRFSDEDDSLPNQTTKFTKSNSNNGRKLTFQLNDDSVQETPPSDSKFKGHQSTPYPKQKLRQLQDDLEVVSSTVEIAEKRNPEFLAKLGSLNRSFIRWIDIYFNKGYNYDFTPVCNDYIRFINSLKDRYPVESANTSSNSVEKTTNNCLNDSPMKSKFNFMQQSAFAVNTPPPNPGDKDYKSTPFPKHLLNNNKQSQQDSFLDSIGKSKTVDAAPLKFDFISQQAKPSAEVDSVDEQKKEIKFPILTTSSSNESSMFKFNKQTTATAADSNPIIKNLFDIKPNQLTCCLYPSAKDAPSPQAKPIDSSFFSPEKMMFKLNPTAKPFDSSNQTTITQLANSSSTAIANLASQPDASVSVTNEDDENYVPPKPEAIFVEEDASYSVKCKLFLKKDSQYVEKGVGTLYIKETNDEAGNQLLIRGDNSLGTIMLNIRLKQSLPIIPTKKGLLLSIPNVTSDDKDERSSETLSFYIKVKTNEIRDELNSFIKKYSV